METLSVNTFVKDIRRTIDFYGLLGFKISMTVPDKGDPIWGMMTNGGITIMIQSLASLGNELPDIDRAKSGGTLIFYIKVTGIRSFYEEIKDKVEIVKTLEKAFYGATEFTIKDIDGFHLTFAETER
ncbi:VOC family protein [Dyadobacter aurulentus]|uniref:VOC family protein n=1 Tax=Dyadobacter sp. UC 10 TaxID=2605428 RepID=UPI0011F1D415|nr:VOC family protein [Dyadobacter sp. UC 10]KAA0991326.1 glyoxalase [Dyadobacter sp. UC 10]